MNNTIKTVGDWELDVLAIPFGDRNNKDLQGEYFTSATDLSLDKLTNPLVIYHHGSGQDQVEVIGQALEHTVKDDGVWVKVKLDQASKYARRVWRAAQRGFAAASSGSIAHLVRRAKDGFISAWPLVELSLFDIDRSQNRQPANPAAVAIPAKSTYSMPEAQAIYKAAGRTMPEIDEGKALQAQAKEILMRMKVDEALEDKAFSRPPTEEEQLYQDAALGVLRHFQSNVKVESMPVRIVSESLMPSSALGAKLGGQYTDRGILISDFLNKEAEYKIFLHELGHCLDEQIGGEKAKTASVDVREKQADFYKDLIGFYAIDQARRQFYGGKLAVKSIPINKLLEALK